MTLTAEEFDIIQAAMTVARRFQITKVKRLTEKLTEMYPGKEESIKRALAYLGDQLRRTA